MSADLQNWERVTPLIRIFSHPLRLRILDFLETTQSPQRVTEIVEVSEGAQQAIVSQQLRILRDAGIVAAERKGNCVYYSIQDSQNIYLLHCIRKYINL
jgi:DNA-binding transcriptional ArsR family regulator